MTIQASRIVHPLNVRYWPAGDVYFWRGRSHIKTNIQTEGSALINCYETMRKFTPVIALLASGMVSAHEDLPCSEDTDDHGQRLSILAPLVKAYIADHGKWPSEVGALIPAYLDKDAKVLEAAPVAFIAEKNLIISGSCILEETSEMRSLRICYYNIETSESNC